MTSPHTHSGAQNAKRKRSVAVPYKDAAILGVISAWLVLMVVIISTQAWKALHLLVAAVGYSVGTFIIVTLGAMLMNKLVSHQTHDADEIDRPVLH